MREYISVVLSHPACCNLFQHAKKLSQSILKVLLAVTVFVAFLGQAEIIGFDKVFYFLSNSRKKNYSGKTIKDLIFSYSNIKNVQL